MLDRGPSSKIPPLRIAAAPDFGQPAPEESINDSQLRLLHRAMQDSELVTENEDLKLECRAAAERSQQGREQCGQHEGERESAKGAQLPFYQSGRNL